MGQGSPSEGHGHDPGTVLSDLEEGGLGQVKMLEGRVASPSVVVSEGVVWRAEVGGSDHNGPREAPPGVVGALHLVACAAAEAIVEEGRAKRGGVRAVTLAVEVAIATSPSYI